MLELHNAALLEHKLNPSGELTLAVFIVLLQKWGQCFCKSGSVNRRKTKQNGPTNQHPT